MFWKWEKQAEKRRAVTLFVLLRNKFLFVVVWKTWCAFCLQNLYLFWSYASVAPLKNTPHPFPPRGRGKLLYMTIFFNKKWEQKICTSIALIVKIMILLNEFAPRTKNLNMEIFTIQKGSVHCTALSRFLLCFFKVWLMEKELTILEAHYLHLWSFCALRSETWDGDTV